MADLTCQLGPLKMRNPFVLASGVLGTSNRLLERIACLDIGAVTTKSCSLNRRAGHANPTALDWGAGLINAIGLTNPGAKAEAENLAAILPRLHEEGALLFVSIFAKDVAEFGETARILAQVQPDLIEANLSCPNVADEFGMPFAAKEDTAAAATEAVKKAVGDLPVAIKLAPNVPNIGAIARAVREAGADVICAVNSMPGMIIDARSASPVLKNKVGGISGPALKPIALKCVADVARAVDLPIIGTGGVCSGVDAAEMIMAGATAVGVGSAVYYRGVDVFQQLPAELAAFMDEEGYADLESMRGKAIL